MEEFFEDWDLEPEDKKAYFVCQNCAKRMKKCSNFNELYKEKSIEEIKKEKISKLESDIERMILTRKNINKNIKNVRAEIKKLI